MEQKLQLTIVVYMQQYELFNYNINCATGTVQNATQGDGVCFTWTGLAAPVQWCLVCYVGYIGYITGGVAHWH